MENTTGDKINQTSRVSEDVFEQFLNAERWMTAMTNWGFKYPQKDSMVSTWAQKFTTNLKSSLVIDCTAHNWGSFNCEYTKDSLSEDHSTHMQKQLFTHKTYHQVTSLGILAHNFTFNNCRMLDFILICPNYSRHQLTSRTLHTKHHRKAQQRSE